MDSLLFNKEIGEKVCDGIKRPFTFPFIMDYYCQPDGKTHAVVDGTFYLNGHFVDYEIDVTNTGEFDMTDLKGRIDFWTSGLMEDKKPVLKKIITDCLNEVLVDVDLFSYWDELNMDSNESDDDDYENTCRISLQMTFGNGCNLM